jgi:hypothetical protein
MPVDRHGWVRVEGWDWRRPRPKVPPAIGADLERRAARREVRATTWFARRARWTAGCWAVFAAVVTPAGLAADPGEWVLWLATGAGSLLSGGLWALQATRESRRNPGLPLPAAPAPATRELSGSAAAEPLRRGEASITAFLALSRPVPPGPTADLVRSAMSSAVEVVDGLRLRAARVLGCEAAARAVVDPAGRAHLNAVIVGLVGEMTAAVRALDDLVAATAEVVGAGVWTPGYGAAGLPAVSSAVAAGADGPLADLTALAEQAENLRGYAAGLRGT